MKITLTELQRECRLDFVKARRVLEFLEQKKIKATTAEPSSRSASYADAEATLKHIILGGIADGHPKSEKQVDAIADNLFKPETLWCIKMLLQRHSA